MQNNIKLLMSSVLVPLSFVVAQKAHGMDRGTPSSVVRVSSYGALPLLSGSGDNALPPLTDGSYVQEPRFFENQWEQKGILKKKEPMLENSIKLYSLLQKYNGALTYSESFDLFSQLNEHWCQAQACGWLPQQLETFSEALQEFAKDHANGDDSMWNLPSAVTVRIENARHLAAIIEENVNATIQLYLDIYRRLHPLWGEFKKIQCSLAVETNCAANL